MHSYMDCNNYLLYNKLAFIYNWLLPYTHIYVTNVTYYLGSYFY